MDFDKVQDSGSRQEFSTGSVRDTAEGKGEPHLIASIPFIKLFERNISSSKFENIEVALLSFSENRKNREDGNSHLFLAMRLTVDLFSSPTEARRRLSVHFSNGAKKYSKNNYRKGQPISRYYDSAMRHLWKAMDGLEDEDHLAALLWNICAIIQTQYDIKNGYLPKELNDFPFTIEEIFGKK